ncbi:MAG: DUF4142 domain-containing protein [Planctomycetota bacterium]
MRPALIDLKHARESHFLRPSVHLHAGDLGSDLLSEWRETAKFGCLRPCLAWLRGSSLLPHPRLTRINLMSYPKIVLSVVALLPSLMLRAQDKPSTQSPSVPAVKAKSNVAEADKLLASWLMAGCNNEVALARIGVRKAQNVEVKQFAQKMLDEHAELELKLRPFAGTDAKVGSGARVPGKGSDDSGKADREPADASGVRSRVAQGEFDHIALIRDLSKRCLESQTKMLEAKTDADFDQCFMQGQVGLHTQAVSMVEVFGNYASGDLSPTLEQAGKTLRAHLAQATTLCKKCESGAKTDKPQNNQK